ncbi:MAG: tRNA (N6-isopentenyl adenosine(37)-C2)-methylthiotransferase MiaB [Bdellovibrionales bacterium]|nr:tRNA (N6-isopentenyl adenosine(37)-C2)-methylthiotransferase MiaB [Bdellovibrionales bacterium]
MESSPKQLPNPDDTSRPGVYVKTFGCQMNEYDSEKMLALLAKSYRPVQAPEDAELVIVNTCSVREKGEHKLFSLLGSLAELKRTRPELVIGVGGCVAQQEGQQILKRNRAVDFVVGTHNLSLIPSLVNGAREGIAPQVAIDYREEWEELPDEFDAVPLLDPHEANDRTRFGLHLTPVRALVAIQRGCDKMCSYCVVPNTRGKQVSRALEEIVKEVRLKVRLGAKEVLLLGQTVNSYGIDLQPRVRFETLIRKLAEIDGLHRIRFTAPHPAEVRPAFIELYGDVPQLCPHIHLPLQSGSDRILKLMNRNYRRERYLEIVRSLRERLPSLAVTADIIVGFPTETEEDFQDTLAVMQQVRYNSTYSFKYSERPHTAAREQFSSADQVPPEVAHDRLLRLQALQDSLSEETNAGWRGQVVEVLVEGPNKTISSWMRGRIPQNTLVELVQLDEALPNPVAGELVHARIVHSSPYGLRGELCRSEENASPLDAANGVEGRASV